MLRFVARRILQAVLLMTVAATVVFFLVRIASTDPVHLILPDFASEKAIADLRAELNLDRPIWVQYATFLRRAVVGDFGRSYFQQRPAMDVVLDAFPTTLVILIGGFAIGMAAAIPLGVLSATRPGSWIDTLTTSGVLFAQSMPTFWVGMILIYLFAVRLSLLPTSGYGDFRYYLLPWLSLATWVVGLLTRVTKSRVQEILKEPFVAVAKAKGLSNARVLNRHVLRLGMIEIASVAGVEFGYLISGAVLTETVFALPGLGSVGIRAIVNGDYPIVQAVVIFSALALVLINVMLDILYVFLDPRISLE